MKSPIAVARNLLNRKNVREFRELHLFGYSILCTLLLDGFRDVKGKQIVFRAVKNRYIARLRKQNGSAIKQYLSERADVALPHERSNKVWFCWLQGLENAPELVKKCYESLQKYLPKDRELVLITEENLKDYVVFPEHISKQYASGKITMTLLSDIIRLNLLIQYGGTWVDSTVFLSDGDIPQAVFDSDLFLFQFSDPKNFYKINKGFDDRCLAVSSWFITSCTNNEILLLTRYLLYHVLQKDDVKDYFICHYMMQLAFETYPEIWNKIPFFCSKNAFALQERMFDAYNEKEWEIIKRCSPIHKLTYKPLRDKTPDRESYCGKLLRGEI